MAALKNGKIGNSKVEASFFSTGFINWKNVSKNIRKHEGCFSHKEAVNRHTTLPQQTRDIGESQSAHHATENSSWPIFAMYDSLARQWLTIRDHDEMESVDPSLLYLVF